MLDGRRLLGQSVSPEGLPQRDVEQAVGRHALSLQRRCLQAACVVRSSLGGCAAGRLSVRVVVGSRSHLIGGDACLTPCARRRGPRAGGFTALA